MSNDHFGRLTWTLIASAVLLQVVIFVYAFDAAADGRAKVDAVSQFIYCSIDRSQRTLPTIEYYRQHPGELEEQLAALADQKLAFVPPPEPCVP